jgi:hypothetical protein
MIVSFLVVLVGLQLSFVMDFTALVLESMYIGLCYTTLVSSYVLLSLFKPHLLPHQKRTGVVDLTVLTINSYLGNKRQCDLLTYQSSRSNSALSITLFQPYSALIDL